MKGFIGTDKADLQPGAVIISGHNLELRIVVIAAATEEQAMASAEELGIPLVIVPGETFYEVDVTTMPVGGDN